LKEALVEVDAPDDAVDFETEGSKQRITLLGSFGQFALPLFTYGPGELLQPFEIGLYRAFGVFAGPSHQHCLASGLLALFGRHAFRARLAALLAADPTHFLEQFPGFRRQLHASRIANKEDLVGLRRNRAQVFQAPPIEWVQERVTQLQDILERSTDRSGVLLRNLLGPLRLVPTRGDIGRPYYTAHTHLNTLALLETPRDPGTGAETGSNSLQWWARQGSNLDPPVMSRMLCR
jgi:hypothetical protein